MELTHGESGGEGPRGLSGKHLSLRFITTQNWLMVAPGTVESYHSAEKWVRRSQRLHPLPTYTFLAVSKAWSCISSLDSSFLPSNPRLSLDRQLLRFSLLHQDLILSSMLAFIVFFPPALNKQPHEPYLQATNSLVFFLSLVWAMTNLCPFSP